MPPRGTGICPNCAGGDGRPGEACPHDLCGRKGYHLVPKEWYLAALEFAERKRKPLDPLLGRYVDRYLLAGKLGEGGMGSVYLAIQKPLGREVAIKLISGIEMTQAALARFEREARAISILDHPNIVKLFDYGIGTLEFKVPYMALEYVRHAPTLKRSLSRVREAGGGAIPGNVVLSIFKQMLNALGAAHKVGIVHRDMKPDNVMVTSVEGNPYMVKLLDFGLAKAVAEVAGFDKDVSATGQFLGTPYYMAPEQVPKVGQPKVDGRADLYAVAVMLYEVFTGVRPYDGDSSVDIMLRKMDPGYRPLDFPHALGLPAPLRSFLARGLAIDPANRFPTAEEMGAALETVLMASMPDAVGLTARDAGSSRDRPMTPPSTEILPGVLKDLETQAMTIPQRKTMIMPDSEEVEIDLPDIAPRPRRIWPYVLGPVAGLVCGAGLYLAFSDEGGREGASEISPAEDIPMVYEVMAGGDVTPVVVSDVPADSVVDARRVGTFVVESSRQGTAIAVAGKAMGTAPVTVEVDLSMPDAEIEIAAGAPDCGEAILRARAGDAVKAGRVVVEIKCRKAQKKKSKIEML